MIFNKEQQLAARTTSSEAFKKYITEKNAGLKEVVPEQLLANIHSLMFEAFKSGFDCALYRLRGGVRR